MIGSMVLSLSIGIHIYEPTYMYDPLRSSKGRKERWNGLNGRMDGWTAHTTHDDGGQSTVNRQSCPRIKHKQPPHHVVVPSREMFGGLVVRADFCGRRFLGRVRLAGGAYFDD